MVLPRFFQRTISLTLILLLVSYPLIGQQGNTVNDFLQGKADGEMDAKGNPAWILGGALCGIFGVAGAYFIKPNPPTDALIGKSAEYVMGYTEGYQNKSRQKNAAYACSGWAAFVVIFLAAGGLDISE